MPAKEPIGDRLARRTESRGSCVVFTGHLGPGGYGVISEGRKLKKAHRVSWELANGPIPPGLHVLHRCDNPPCVNVEHLFLGTHRENMADMWSKGRARGHLHNAEKARCPHGHPFSGQNIRAFVDRLGHNKRQCRECDRLRAQRKRLIARTSRSARTT